MVIRNLIFGSLAEISWHVHVAVHLIITVIVSGFRNLVIYKPLVGISVGWHETQEA